MNIEKLLNQAISQNADVQYRIRMTAAEKVMLSNLADAYEIKMAEVFKLLLRDAAIKQAATGNVAALKAATSSKEK